jgi:thiamine-monophosphate kinase
MAQSGDIICVTGPLGDSATGLKILLEQPILSSKYDSFIKKHHQPEPRLDEGAFLATYPEIHSMMDISDGIASDLKHILKASGKHAVIEIDKLPLSNELKKISIQQSWDMIELAAAGGEDYELLLTVDAKKLTEIQYEFLNRFGKPLYSIGYILNGESSIRWLKEGVEYTFSKSGFNHFVNS